MKISTLKSFNRIIFIFFTITFLFVFHAQSQNKNDQKADSISVKDNSIAIENISDETEKLSQWIIKLKKILLPSTEITEVDSLLFIATSEINFKRDSLIKSLETTNRRLLKVNKVVWEDHRSQVKGYQKTLKDRTEVLSEINDEILDALNKWIQTRDLLKNSGKSKDVYASLNLVIESLQETLVTTHDRLNSILSIQKRLTDIVLIIDEVISEIELVELQMQKDYFVFDSEPIWKSMEIGTNSVDNIDVEKSNSSTMITSGIQRSKEQIKDFISQNKKTFVMQVLFILLMLFFMIAVNKKWNKESKEIIKPIEIEAKIVLANPISASLVVGSLISAFFYDSLIPAFSELIVIIILVGTVYLLPKLTFKSFRSFLLLIFLSYALYYFESYLGSKSSIVRILILLDAIILGFALILGRKIINKSPEPFAQVYKIYKAVAPIYIFILIVAIIANIIGMVSLSGYLTFGVLSSVILGMVIFLNVKIITSLVILLFKLKRSLSIQTLSAMVDVTYTRIQPILIWVGVVIWLMFTLSGFELFDFIVLWVNDIMNIHWNIGEMTISLGGVLSFLGIFIVSLILAKLVAAIFQDEWMVNVLPRGVAPAISLLMRIIFISIGLYMALSSAGIDLSKLGFMFGALGVGIGFGLQNVVLNFVAGLILAFERPINLGDTIEVDQEFGVVTNIGIRSSNIKSYSGYEAIIPNGDLISKKVINYTLSNRDRRSKIQMKTSANANPEKVITLLSEVAAKHPNTHKKPEPKTYFYGYDADGNLSFTLLYWTTFSNTLETDNAIALKIFAKLGEEGIQAPAPVRRIVNEK